MLERRSILIAGGGIAGLEALMALSSLGDWQLRLHVLASRDTFSLRPQAIGVPWGGPPMTIALDRICRAFGAGFDRERVVAVDDDARTVATASGGTFAYDELLLAPGAHPVVPYPGARVVGFGALPHELAASRAHSVAVLVPPTVSWALPAYELALLAAGSGHAVGLYTAEQAPLEAFGPAASERVADLMRSHGIDVHAGGAPALGTDVGDLADDVIALPPLTGPGIAGLPVTPDGFVRVDATMAVAGTGSVFAAGDAIDSPVKQGGLAAQQATVAATAIVRRCGGDPPDATYAPVLRGKLHAPDGTQLYLRRDLTDDADAGRADSEPLWRPEGAICAWRLSRWLEHRRGELEAFTVDHVARPLPQA